MLLTHLPYWFGSFFITFNFVLNLDHLDSFNFWPNFDICLDYFDFDQILKFQTNLKISPNLEKSVQILIGSSPDVIVNKLLMIVRLSNLDGLNDFSTITLYHMNEWFVWNATKVRWGYNHHLFWTNQIKDLNVMSCTMSSPSLICH